jgi:hypothetical protein
MIHESKLGYFYIMLDASDATDLRFLLHPEAEHIWIHAHRPDPALRWWSADVPISPGIVMPSAQIRLMEFDLMMTRSDFLDRLDLFELHGLCLTQLSRPVPNSLWLQALPEDQIERILLQNGMRSRYFLPHAAETAQFSCTDKTHLERVIVLPEIRAKLRS